MRRALPLLVAALAACSVGPDPRREPADVARATAAEHFGDLATAERELAPLFLDDVPRARRGEVFWAGWFLASAHARAAFEPRAAGLGGGGVGAAHAQAALFYARRARLGFDAAPDLPPPELDYDGSRDDDNRREHGNAAPHSSLPPASRASLRYSEISSAALEMRKPSSCEVSSHRASGPTGMPRMREQLSISAGLTPSVTSSIASLPESLWFQS